MQEREPLKIPKIWYPGVLGCSLLVFHRRGVVSVTFRVGSADTVAIDYV